MSDNKSSQNTEQDFSCLTEQEVRLAKVQKMRKQGIEPWPGFKPVTATADEVVTEFSDDVDDTKDYAVAGRLTTMRLHGKTAFAHLQDRSGKIQVYIRQDIVGPELFDHVNNFFDVGDIMWVKGKTFRTKTGEVTIKADDVALVSKSLHPMPEKFHGLTDIETIYRQRYLDLISNKESRERFAKRAQIIQVMRQFLLDHDFVEVETPMLHPIPGGAIAKPFVTHHNALDSEFYLRVAPELYLKRLVVGGFERVFEINRNFRNEGISTKHNPEFTMAEWYMAHQDYKFMMTFIEDMLKKIVSTVCGDLQVQYGDYTLDFEKPFEKIALHDSVIKYTDCTQDDLSAKNIDATLKKHNIHVANKKASVAEKVYRLFEELVEPKLIQPTFITNFPIEVSPLSKRDENNPQVAARFELFIAGMELSNGFNELNDPHDQAERFKAQVTARNAGDAEAHHYDADYVLALEHALPPTVGVGIGIDRLAMLLTNTTSIKDVILFPTLKKEKK